MTDYYDGIDREGEKEQRLMEKVYEWWDSLDEEEQYNLMCDWYPNDFTKDKYDDADSFFGDLPSSKKLWIWKRENHLTEEDIEGQRDIAGDMEYEERKIEGGL